MCGIQEKTVRSSKHWTDIEVDVLVKRYPNELTEDIAKDLCRSVCSLRNKAHTLGIKKSEAFIRKFGHGSFLKGEIRSSQTMFKKGHIPWNKGKKIPFNENSAKTQFKPGNIPHNHKPIGSERLTYDGYLLRKVSDTGYPTKDWIGVHVLLWEEHNGKLPKDHCVVFKDGNKTNIVIENLECISRKELMKRNSIHNYPKEIIQLHKLRGALNRQINKKIKEKNNE